MATDLKVSVIVPNYNHSRYLRQRIDSVLAQTYQEFELIILDDCSQDDSKAVIEEYRNHSQVSQIVYNEINSGSTFQQWKKGIGLAKGEWIWIAESDDYCDARLLASLLANTELNKYITLAYCQSYFREEGNPVERDMRFYTDQLSTQHWQSDYVTDGANEVADYLLFLNTIPNASAVLFKKSAYLQADRDFEQMRLCGDWMLWVQLLKKGNIAFCATPHNSFRAHNATTRVLDTMIKRRVRLEEEYRVVLSIRNGFPGIDQAKVTKRLVALAQEYSRLFIKKELLQIALHPASYVSAIPYQAILRSKLSRLVELALKKVGVRQPRGS